MRCKERSIRRRPLRSHELCRPVCKIPYGSRSTQGISGDAPLPRNALQSHQREREAGKAPPLR